MLACRTGKGHKYHSATSVELCVPIVSSGLGHDKRRLQLVRRDIV